MFPKSGAWVGLFLTVFSVTGAYANTSITFTRSDIATMATLWETDSAAISSLPNNQYPNVAGSWVFIDPHSNISSDGDIHIDMAIDAAGTGSSANNIGASPLIAEVINATSSQLSHLISLTNQRAIARGIFRFYTEHSSERHFELHPATQLQRWNGSAYVNDTDYHSNIVSVPDGDSHATSTLVGLFNGTQMITATIAADNNGVMLQCPSPSVNYVQYEGVALSGLLSDGVSQYFLFQPDLVPNATVRCRLIAGTTAASAAAGIIPNQSMTINALTRTDMAAIHSQINSMTSNQQRTFARPVELIILGLPTIGPVPTPTPSATTFVNANSIAILTNSQSPRTAASPYPSTVTVAGMPGVISKVTVALNDFNTSAVAYPADIDILMTGPAGQNTILMSDAGGSGRLRHVNLVFDDNAAANLPTSQITSGMYRPTDYTPADNADLFPAPAPGKPFGTTLSLFNGTSPNGTWNLFVLDEYIEGSGSIAGGWGVTISTVPAAPLVNTTAASNVKSTSATLNGTINPLGQSSSYAFQMGTSVAYGFIEDTQAGGSGTSASNVSLSLTGLQPGRTYHYRLTGANSAGVANGADITFTTAAFVDTDGDGMPNDYEIAVGLNPNSGLDAGIDSDGDGMINLDEYRAGTDPRVLASVLRISSVEISGGDAVITFPSVFGKTYRLEQRPGLTDSWSILSDNIAGTGDTVSVPDVEAGDQYPKRFYRVVVMP